MVIGRLEKRGDVSAWKPVGHHVMGSLDVEGFFDFGVGCYEEVEEYEERDEKVENYIYCG